MVTQHLRNNSQRGAILIDYSIALVLVVAVFAVAAYGVMMASAARAKESIGTTQTIAPCGTNGTSNRLNRMLSDSNDQTNHMDCF